MRHLDEFLREWTQSSFFEIPIALQGVDISSSGEEDIRVNLLERITVEPGKCGGRPCIRSLRIRVTDVLGMLAGGSSEADILRDFPYLEPDDIKAALMYAAREADHAVLQAG